MSDRIRTKESIGGIPNGLKIQTAISLFETATMSRSDFIRQLGKTHGGNRNLYEELGYPLVLKFSDYLERYLRQDIAKRIVDAPVNAVWVDPPKIMDDKEDPENKTAFEARFVEVEEESNLWGMVRRWDKLISIGSYGVLFLGFSDGNDPKLPVNKSDNLDLLFVQPYSEPNAEILTYDTDPQSARFGLPLAYRLSFDKQRTNPSSGRIRTRQISSIEVHWSRVVHGAEDLLEDNLVGTPRLQAIYNRLQDLELVSGSSAEAFWRLAFPGYAFTAKDNATWDPTKAEEMTEEIDEFIHSMRRYLRLQGVDVKELSGSPSDPRPTSELYLKLISGASGIPLRILTGSERGELASSQDEKNWKARVSERAKIYCEPDIVRPLVDRLIEFGVLPEPKDGKYEVVWPDLFSLGEKEKAEVVEKKVNALAKYTGASGSEAVLPIDDFLKEVFGYDEAKIKQIKKLLMSAEAELEEEEEEFTVPEDAIEEEEERESA